jgi:hypothetical protein
VATAGEVGRYVADVVTNSQSTKSGSNAKTVDVVVVGGGHNGLTCAAFLAVAGKRVLVLEARDTVGGLVWTMDMPNAPGFKVSPCSVEFVLPGLKPSIVDQLELHKHGLRWVHPTALTTWLGPDGASVGFYQDIARTKAENRQVLAARRATLRGTGRHHHRNTVDADALFPRSSVASQAPHRLRRGQTGGEESRQAGQGSSCHARLWHRISPGFSVRDPPMGSQTTGRGEWCIHPTALSGRPKFPGFDDDEYTSTLMLCPTLDYMRPSTVDGMAGTFTHEIPMATLSSSVYDRSTTPPDFEERYFLHGGNYEHVDLTLNQLGPTRPIPAPAGYESPVERVCHSGAGAFPMAYISGWPGRNTAAAVLKGPSGLRRRARKKAATSTLPPLQSRSIG